MFDVYTGDGIKLGRAKDTAQPPTTQRKASQSKEHVGQNVGGVETKELFVK